MAVHSFNLHSMRQGPVDVVKLRGDDLESGPGLEAEYGR